MFRRLGIDERKGKTCATDREGHSDVAATYYFEAGGVGSYYCSECQRKISMKAADKVASEAARLNLD